jgi:serralysin
MFRTAARLTLVLIACVAATAVPGTAQASGSGSTPTTALLGDGGKPIPLKNAAMILRTEWGYRYIAGQQDSDLTVREVDGNLVYTDRGTQELRDIPSTCSRKSVDVGIAAVCSVPAKYDSPNSMFLEIWPRLGDDTIDGSSLPSTYRMWVLGDKGDDVVRTGAGDDFVNGAQDNDTVWGGDGNDWIRTGIGNDTIYGGAGDDKLVGADGHDEVHGGDGNDRVGGGAGSDRLYAGAGKDVVACGGGSDSAWVDSLDRATQCESVSRSRS